VRETPVKLALLRLSHEHVEELAVLRTRVAEAEGILSAQQETVDSIVRALEELRARRRKTSRRTETCEPASLFPLTPREKKYVEM